MTEQFGKQVLDSRDRIIESIRDWYDAQPALQNHPEMDGNTTKGKEEKPTLECK